MDAERADGDLLRSTERIQFDISPDDSVTPRRETMVGFGLNEREAVYKSICSPYAENVYLPHAVDVTVKR